MCCLAAVGMMKRDTAFPCAFTAILPKTDAFACGAAAQGRSMDYIEFFLRTLEIPDIREALEGGDGEGEGERERLPFFVPLCQRLMPVAVVLHGRLVRAQGLEHPQVRPPGDSALPRPAPAATCQRLLPDRNAAAWIKEVSSS